MPASRAEFLGELATTGPTTHREAIPSRSRPHCPSRANASRRRGRSILRFAPVVADTDVHCERRVEWIRASHLLAHEFLDGAELGVGDFEQQLVVDLEHELRTASFFAQATVDVDHSDL